MKKNDARHATPRADWLVCRRGTCLYEARPRRSDDSCHAHGAFLSAAPEYNGLDRARVRARMRRSAEPVVRVAVLLDRSQLLPVAVA